MIGRELGHFRIVAELGAGGMGTVYRAEDTRLERQVAIKVLPKAFTEDAERLARFEREARLLASLNHANVAGIYEVGEVDGVHFLAMELAAGEDLADRIARGPIPVDQALAIALQIAAGLEAAHQQDIIHRDLKPANVKVTRDNQVKILDFGLAKAWEGPKADGPGLTTSPTLTAQMTQAGVILGTAAYMSPEQARGEEADQRADVWSFGVILFEMLVGKQLFREPTVSDTLAAVLRADLGLDDLPADTPWQVRDVLARCLERDPRNRLHAIADVRIGLKERAPPAASTREEHSSRGAAWLGAAAVFVLGVIATRLFWPTAAPPPRLRQLQIDTGTTLPRRGSLAISRDGSFVVYGGTDPTRLYRRDLDALQPVPIPGTEGGSSPILSPDDRELVFVAGGAVKKVSVRGGSPIVLYDPAKRYGAEGRVDTELMGGDWSSDGTLYLSLVDFGSYGYSTLFTLSERGGEIEELLPMLDEAGKPREHQNPQLLPGEDKLLFNWMPGNVTFDSTSGAVKVLDLDSGEVSTLLEGRGYARYLPSGHLLSATDVDTFRVAPFDVGRLAVTGPEVPLHDRIGTTSGIQVRFAMAPDGTAVFEPVPPPSIASELVWLGLDGSTSTVDLGRSDVQYPTLSPDGRRIAVSIRAQPELGIFDLDRRRYTTRPIDRVPRYPMWSRDGRRIFFQGGGEGEPLGIYSIEADGGGVSELLVETRTVWTAPWDTSPDGTMIAAFVWDPDSEADWDIVLVPASGGQPIPFAAERHSQMGPRFSPDGHWISFVADRSGRLEAYVASYPDEGPWIQVTDQGAERAFWSRDGLQLYLVDGESRLLVSEVTAGTPLVFGRPELVLEIPGALKPGSWMPWASLSPDGTRLLIQRDRGRVTTHLNVVLDWPEELERLAPTKR